MGDAIKLGPCRLEQCPERILSNPGKWKLQGHSKAGERTGFWIEQLKICLDAGLSTYRSPKAIFISHTHTDHSFQFVQMVTRRSAPIKGQEKLQGRPLYFPTSGEEPLTTLIYATWCLSDGKMSDKAPLPILFKHQGTHPFPVEPFKKFTVPGINNIEVETLPAYHSVDSIGYGFSSIKIKLKDEYMDLAKNDVQKFIKLKAHVNVYRRTVIPELVFFSDSTIDNLTKHDEWKKYPVIMVECTGFSEIHTPDKTYAIAHTHWDHLFPVMLEHQKTHPNTEWIIIHTSMGMDNTKLKPYQTILDDNKINGYIWLSGNTLETERLKLVAQLESTKLKYETLLKSSCFT
jgi:ribonuclease Z